MYKLKLIQIHNKNKITQIKINSDNDQEVYYSPCGKPVYEDYNDILYQLLEINKFNGNTYYSDLDGWLQQYKDYYFSNKDPNMVKFYNDIE